MIKEKQSAFVTLHNVCVQGYRVCSGSIRSNVKKTVSAGF